MPLPDPRVRMARLAAADAAFVRDLTAWHAALGGGPQTDLLDLGRALREAVVGVSRPALLTPGAPIVIDLLTRHPLVAQPARELFIGDVFTRAPGPEAQRWLADSLDVLARGAVSLAATGPADDRLVDALLASAFSADRASVAVRSAMLGRPAPGPDPVGPEFPPPNIPILDRNRLERLVVWGTINQWLQALRRAGRAYRDYADWVARAHADADGIAGLVPDHGCAGARVVLQGAGFGSTPPVYTSVYFAAHRGGCVRADLVLQPDGTPDWSDTAITVTAPPDVGIGCVGFVHTDGPPPSDPFIAQAELAEAAGMVQSVLGGAFGPVGVLHGQAVVEGVAHLAGLPPLPCPPCLPESPDHRVPNRFVGGPPVIRSFTVNGAPVVQLLPGGSITLAWVVEGADSIEISTRTASTSPWPAGLPQPPVGPGPLSPVATIGPFSVPWEGADDWDGEYVLAASNPCSSTPTVEIVRVEMREPPPLFGLADTHAHFMANLAFAGYGIWGNVHAADPNLDQAAALAQALPHCDGPNGHGPGGTLPSLEGIGGHLVGGCDEFDGWPRHTTLAHQQAYVDWIKRAVDGGLRLAVCLAVNNELLATRLTQLFGRNGPISDRDAIVWQLDAVAGLIAYLDAQAGGAGLGWMEIARTPADARRIIAAGRLAIVLGVEVDSLGGWRTPAHLEDAARLEGREPGDLIADLVRDLYDRGVRHVFPIHASNNAFGGPALFHRNYDGVNYFLTEHSFNVATADQDIGIAYRLEEDDVEGGLPVELLAYYGVEPVTNVFGAGLAGAALGGLVGGSVAAAGGFVAAAGIAAAQYPCPPKPTNWSGVAGGHINAQGLTHYGKLLLTELMRRGMLVDVDHMGHRTTECVLEICEKHQYPVVSGHTSLRELKFGYQIARSDPNAQFSRDVNAVAFGTRNAKRLSSEVDKSPEQLERIRRLGGMVSLITYQRDLQTNPAEHVPNDSAGSSKSFAQALLYLHARMHGRRLALGTDINGAGQLPGPRFGPQASAAISDEADWRVRVQRGLPLREQQTFAQRDGVRYASPILDYRHHRFMDYAGHPDRAPFDADQRDFWEALAIWRTGTPPEQADQPSIPQRSVATQNFIINLATGLRAASRAAIPLPIPFPPSRPWPFFDVNADEQLAAYLAAHPDDDPLRDDDPDRTRQLVPKLIPVWRHWQAMERGAPSQATDQWTQQHFGPAGSGLYEANGKLTRSTAGRRDFDINMDGMAHYGLLPDFLQDLRNVGVQPQTMQALYRSAEDYVRVWERCEAKQLP